MHPVDGSIAYRGGLDLSAVNRYDVGLLALRVPPLRSEAVTRWFRFSELAKEMSSRILLEELRAPAKHLANGEDRNQRDGIRDEHEGLNVVSEPRINLHASENGLKGLRHLTDYSTRHPTLPTLI